MRIQDEQTRLAESALRLEGICSTEAQRTAWAEAEEPECTLGQYAQNALKALHIDVCRSTGADVELDILTTECGKWHAGSFVIYELPWGASGKPGILASIQIPASRRRGLAVLGSNWRLVAENVDFLRALKLARFEIVRAYREKCEGAYYGPN